MIIDVIFFLLMLVAIYKGYTKGLVIAIFSVIAMMAGIAAAMKLSVEVANYLQRQTDMSGKWLPVLSFVLVFIAVVLLVRLGAVFIEKSLKLALMGWLNRLAGMLLYMFVYLFVLSIILFYAQQLHIIGEETFLESKTWPYLQPIGPKAIEGLGKLIPWFRDMFTTLQEFFENISKKV